MAAVAWGDPSGRPTLAAHGWLDNASSFARIAPLLEGAYLVCVDLPGHGHSSHKPPGHSYHFIEGLPALFAMADSLEFETFHFLGHSLGAVLGSLAAGVFPERIKSLALVEGLGPPVAPDEDLPKRVANYSRHFNRKEPSKLRVYPSRAEAAAAVQGALQLEDGGAEILVERGTKEVDGGVSWRADPRLRGPSAHRLNEPQVRAFLRRITCPALLVMGDDGYPFPADLIAQRAQCVQNLRLERVPGRHHLHLDTPELVAPLINDFWQSL